MLTIEDLDQIKIIIRNETDRVKVEMEELRVSLEMTFHKELRKSSNQFTTNMLKYLPDIIDGRVGKHYAAKDEFGGYKEIVNDLQDTLISIKGVQEIDSALYLQTDRDHEERISKLEGIAGNLAV